MPSWIIITVISLVILFVFIVWVSKYQDLHSKSDLVRAFFYENQVVLLSHVFHSGGDSGDAYRHTRIVCLDMHNGNILHREVYNEELRFDSSHNNLLLLKTTDMFYGFDVATKKRVLDYNLIYKYDDQIKSEKISSIKFNQEALAFDVVTLKGTNKKINLADLATIQSLKDVTNAVTGNSFSFKKDSTDDVFYVHNHDLKKEYPIRFIKPEKVTEFGGNIVLIHYDSLSEFSGLSIALLNADGKIVWEISNKLLGLKHDTGYNGKIELKQHKIYSDCLVLVFEARRDMAVGIDLTSGKLQWKYKI